MGCLEPPGATKHRKTTKKTQEKNTEKQAKPKDQKNQKKIRGEAKPLQFKGFARKCAKLRRATATGKTKKNKNSEK